MICRARRRMGRAALVALCFGLLAAPAGAGCRLALALGLDVSGSVDDAEYRLQLDGVAGALMAPEVQDALFGVPGTHVMLSVYQWGAERQQTVLLRWSRIETPADAAEAAEALRRADLRFDDPFTALGAAMRFGGALLDERRECWQRTLDISGDGPSNAGPLPATVLTDPGAGITINALVVNPGGRDNVTKDLTHTRTLLDHYRAHVLRGPGAFVETARDFSDFEAAMTRKLMREIRPAALSLGPAPQ
ncbi:DUF1194 domain-containing protein [Roseovarius aquimarinus]|uniref:DUF1194 domain-containing protein n=1 Tax=Roseovarius aquimarinus TaxID=1229156 RepID=A0ABW7I7C2_9RHOB